MKKKEEKIQQVRMVKSRGEYQVGVPNVSELAQLDTSSTGRILVVVDLKSQEETTVFIPSDEDWKRGSAAFRYRFKDGDSIFYFDLVENDFPVSFEPTNKRQDRFKIKNLGREKIPFHVFVYKKEPKEKDITMLHKSTDVKFGKSNYKYITLPIKGKGEYMVKFEAATEAGRKKYKPAVFPLLIK